MRKIKKTKKILLGSAMAIAVSSLAFGGYALAATGNGNGYGSANKPDHQLTAAEQEARHEEMETKLTEALKTAKEAGTITEDQYNTLLQKHEAISAKMEAGDRTAGEALIEEMHDWMVAQNIDSSVMPKPNGNGHGPRDGQGNGQHRQNRATNSN